MQLAFQDTSWEQEPLLVWCYFATANLDLGREISLPTTLHKHVTEFIMAGNHIPPMLAGNGSMVAQRGPRKGLDKNCNWAKSMHNHHFRVCEAGEGRNENQATTLGEETDSKRALSGKGE